MARSPVNFAEKLSKLSEHWSPRVVAEMNDYQFKLVKLAGEFVWHRHDETDEAFLVRTVAAVARGLAPGAEALHRFRVDLVAVDDRVQLFLSERRTGDEEQQGGQGFPNHGSHLPS